MPYPGINSYVLYMELGTALIVPVTSILSVFSLLRVYFFLKIFKHLTKWTSSLAEYICDKYAANASTWFAFKAFQKENTFLILLFIFILSCYCFGMGVKTFELLYWEHFDTPSQDWSYQWNAMWFVFVTMTTVGYGDLFPRTQFGRSITILSCFVGVYFVSMMMVFMTFKSIPSEKESKAFKLITRLNIRKEIKDIHASMIFHSLNLQNLRIKNKEGEIEEKEYNYQTIYQKRCITALIEKLKEKKRLINSYDFIPTKEQLLDMSEKLDSDIKDIKRELSSLKSKTCFKYY
jgi:hypothetical protein